MILWDGQGAHGDQTGPNRLTFFMERWKTFVKNETPWLRLGNVCNHRAYVFRENTVDLLGIVDHRFRFGMGVNS